MNASSFVDDDLRVREEIRTLLGETMLVEAGAGTGKTRALVDRVIALILSGVLVERIVAITFTEKAAAELRERVRSGLEADLANAQADIAPVIQAALDSLGRAQISTIHAFCMTLLRSFAAEAGIDPDFEIQDQVLAERRFQDRWRGYLEKLGEEDEAAKVVDRVLSLGMQTSDIETLTRELWNQQHMAARLTERPLAAPTTFWPNLDVLKARLHAIPIGRIAPEDSLRCAIDRAVETIESLEDVSADTREMNLAAKGGLADTEARTNGQGR